MVEEIKKEGFMIKKVIVFMYLKPSFFFYIFTQIYCKTVQYLLCCLRVTFATTGNRDGLFYTQAD